MTEKKGFWYWWLFKGNTEDVFWRLFFIYSSIVTIIFMLIIPLFFPTVFSSLLLEWDSAYIIVILHGWLVALPIAVGMLIKMIYDEYQEE